MDYSNRVNSKKGAGGIASAEDQNVHSKKRVQELLATHILDIDNDPYVFRNHLGILECRLCLTTHNNESSYISHLGGRKHHLNLERRRILDEKSRQQQDFQRKVQDQVSISNVETRHWKKIGRPEYKILKIRDPETLQLGVLVTIKCPEISVDEPFFRLMSYYELSSKNQNMGRKFIQERSEDEEDDEDPSDWQYLVISAEPYENITIIVPNTHEIDKPQEEGKMSETYWWFWDNDTKEFFLQFMYKKSD
ncbi:sap62 [Candida theae]|uniref:Sap62 n=1 Tax=Candida theae TaxID=1198502 RepID=A0AAD5BDQ5_9ASCO|nr:sap62 [Candida theae]KAI5955527.1 sap62 [Candida theae]